MKLGRTFPPRDFRGRAQLGNRIPATTTTTNHHHLCQVSDLKINFTGSAARSGHGVEWQLRTQV
jgi:hypothetical protein